MEYKNKRVGGLVTMIVGVVLGKIFIYDVLQAAKEGRAEINIYRTGIVASILCIILGGLYIIFSDKVEYIIKFDENNLKFQNVLIIFVLGGTGLAGYVWINIKLSALGYK
ncbi:MAG: hypothetical protein PVG39_03560 [Desulfobacteraceae bacterium]